MHRTDGHRQTYTRVNSRKPQSYARIHAACQLSICEAHVFVPWTDRRRMRQPWLGRRPVCQREHWTDCQRLERRSDARGSDALHSHAARTAQHNDLQIQQPTCHERHSHSGRLYCRHRRQRTCCCCCCWCRWMSYCYCMTSTTSDDSCSYCAQFSSCNSFSSRTETTSPNENRNCTDHVAI